MCLCAVIDLAACRLKKVVTFTGSELDIVDEATYGTIHPTNYTVFIY